MTRERTKRIAVPVAVLLLATIIHLPTFDQPLLDRHGFRQTQTAFPALVFVDEGIDLLHAKVPVHGEPWEMPFEFPAYQAVASVLAGAGVGADLAMRLTSFVAFLLAALVLYALLLRQAGMVAAAVGLVGFTLSPLAMLWSRASLIEYPALAATMVFVYSGLRWRTDGRGRWFALALSAAILAALIKLTTVMFWCLPFILLAFARDGQWNERRRALGAWSLTMAPVVVGVLWTRYADGIKAASDATKTLTSPALMTWNFGTVLQRLDPGAWFRVVVPVALLAGLVAAVILIPAAWRSAQELGQRRFFGWVAAAGTLPVLVFFNLYVQHDYYAVAISPTIAVILGYGAAWIVMRWRPVAVGTVAAVAIAAWVLAVPYWLSMFGPADPEHVLPLAAQIERETLVGQRVAIVGRGWTPAILYYADRWGRMIEDWEWTAGLAGRLRDDGYVLYRCPDRRSLVTMCERLEP